MTQPSIETKSVHEMTQLLGSASFAYLYALDVFNTTKMVWESAHGGKSYIYVIESLAGGSHSESVANHLQNELALEACKSGHIDHDEMVLYLDHNEKERDRLREVREDSLADVKRTYVMTLLPLYADLKDAYAGFKPVLQWLISALNDHQLLTMTAWDTKRRWDDSVLEQCLPKLSDGTLEAFLSKWNNPFGL